LIVLAATPFSAGGFDLTPNVAWLMTLIMVSLLPTAWPLGIVFMLGLLQDMLAATPLGSQALIALLLVIVARRRAERGASVFFRVRWLEAAVLLVLAHTGLMLLMVLVTPGSATLTHVLRAGLVSAAWYPLFYGVMRRCIRGRTHDFMKE
jgi:rod shape-determining protein MreD